MKNLFCSIKKQLWLFKHRGNKYTCPFCGYSSDMLLPFGQENEAVRKHHIIGAGRRNARCLKCDSRDRERLIYIYLKQVARIFEKQELEILHIAPELNLAKKLRETNFRYICGDLFTEGYHYPEYVQNMNVLHLPFEGNTFDVILCNHVLEHVPEDRKAMSEIYRVLKPGGCIASSAHQLPDRAYDRRPLHTIPTSTGNHLRTERPLPPLRERLYKPVARMRLSCRSRKHFRELPPIWLQSRRKALYMHKMR